MAIAPELRAQILRLYQVEHWRVGIIEALAHDVPQPPSLPQPTKATLIPVFRYRNAPAAIEWLCETFGFEERLVVPHEDGTIAHAQLSFGDRMIMLGSLTRPLLPVAVTPSPNALVCE